jgi:PAS domain S-box-containing protein
MINIPQRIDGFPAQSFYASLIAIFGGALSVMVGIYTKRIHEIEHRGKLFQALADQGLHPLLLKDKKGQVLYASASIKELLGVKARELLGKDIVDFVHPDEKRNFLRFYQAIFNSPGQKKSLELRMKGLKADWVWMRNDVVNLLHDPAVKAVVASFHDISRQKYLNELRLKSLERERKARATAEKAVQTRDEFLSVASHELKTPLTTILLQLQGTIRQILTQSLANFSGERMMKSLTIAEQQSKRLSSMIKDLLNVSLISTGRIEINKQAGKLGELVKSLVERFAEEMQTQIQVDIQKEITGKWDMIRVEQILTNLLTNATKYGGEKPIHVSLLTEKEMALISVKDLGNGIPRKEHERIFKLFTRGKNNTKKGLGVGLFISRQIARSHGGDVTVASTPGRGSTFTLSLPLNGAQNP